MERGKRIASIKAVKGHRNGIGMLKVNGTWQVRVRLLVGCKDVWPLSQRCTKGHYLRYRDPCIGEITSHRLAARCGGIIVPIYGGAPIERLFVHRRRAMYSLNYLGVWQREPVCIYLMIYNQSELRCAYNDMIH